MTQQNEHAGRIEIATIQPIPLDQRHGTYGDLFTIWFGANLMLLTIVTGGLAVTVFGLPFGWAVAALAIGNLVGGVFMALHAAQGPTLGVPQMVQTRGQFGSLGSLLVIGIVIVMYVGFVSSNLVLCGEALALVTGVPEAAGMVLVSVISVIAAIYGYDLIHAYTRLMSFVCGAALLLAAGWIIWRARAARGFPRSQSLLARRIPRRDLHRRALADRLRAVCVRLLALHAARHGRAAGVLGELLGLHPGLVPADGARCDGGSWRAQGPLMLGLAILTRGIAPLVLIVFTVSIAAASAMNLYCGALSTLTFGQTISPRWSPGPRSRTAVALLLSALSLLGALLSKESFLVNYENFILLLLYVLVPWTAINLVDYYLLRKGRYDVASFFRRDGGIYGRINGAAVTCYAVGILIQLPFISSPLYIGPVARAMGGIDLSWIVGLAVTAPAYYWLAKRSRSHAPVAVIR